jgi:hypothetical protein
VQVIFALLWSKALLPLQDYQFKKDCYIPRIQKEKKKNPKSSIPISLRLQTS